ncbi:MAG: HlyD family efflux transporter periplasmic adaptor subunit [Planctomycetota bacterium]
MNQSNDLQNPHKTLGNTPLLARTDTSGNPLPKDFLERMVSQFDGHGGILWLVDEAPQVCATHSHDDSPVSVQMRREDHERILLEAAAGRAPSLLQTQLNDSSQANLLLIGKVDVGRVYVIEIVIEDHHLDKPAMIALQRRFHDSLQLVNSSQPLFAGQGAAAGNAETSSRQGIQVDELNNYVQLIHSSVDLPMTAANIANETRRLLNYDRVSVLVERNGRQRLIAISGQASVNRRSNTTRLLEQFAGTVLKTGQTFWYPSPEDLPTKIGVSLDDYVQVSQTRSLAIVPVRKLPEPSSDSNEATESQPVIGGIVYEKFQERWERSIDEPRLERLQPHISNSLGNALVNQRIFLYPLWKFLGRLDVLKQPKYFNKVLIGLGIAAVLTLALVFWPVRFYVSADGVLIPSEFKPVFSSMAGEVDQVFVKHGDRVQKGQKLIQLSSREHDFRVEELESKLKTTRQRLTNLEDQRHSPNQEASPAEIEENIVSLRTQIETLEAQRSILNKITEQLAIYSPMDGQVITWDLKRQLANRVVESGVRLMEVAENEGDWMVEIDLPIRRQGHLARALAEGNSEDLKVSFLSAADPSKTYAGHIVGIANAVSISDDNQQVIKVLAAIEESNDDSEIAFDQVRSSVAAKVYCGKSSLGYLWFHDIWEFIQKRVLFRAF